MINSPSQCVNVSMDILYNPKHQIAGHNGLAHNAKNTQNWTIGSYTVVGALISYAWTAAWPNLKRRRTTMICSVCHTCQVPGITSKGPSSALATMLCRWSAATRTSAPSTCAAIASAHSTSMVSMVCGIVKNASKRCATYAHSYGRLSQKGRSSPVTMLLGRPATSGHARYAISLWSGLTPARTKTIGRRKSGSAVRAMRNSPMRGCIWSVWGVILECARD